MTGIPDEVVERVAMAIDEKQHHPMTDYDWSAGVALVKAGESGNPYKLARIRVAMEQARAALSASRWMEMREALEKTDLWFSAENDHSKEPCFYRRVDMCRDAENAVRAALKAGDQT